MLMEMIGKAEGDVPRERVMRKYIESEILKTKRSFVRKMLVLMPVVTVLLTWFMNGNYAQELAYNCWYLLFLPFTESYVCGYLISADRKKNFHGLWGIMQEKQKTGYAKMVVGSLLVMSTNAVFVVLIALVGVMTEGRLVQETGDVVEYGISLGDNLLAGVLLTVIFAWQIPLFLWITIKTNTIVSVGLSVFCNFVIACLCATESFWWIPFAIPARLMCHVLGILPNGLMVEEGTYKGVLEGGFPIVFCGVMITIVLCVVMTGVLGKAFDRQEV